MTPPIRRFSRRTFLKGTTALAVTGIATISLGPGMGLSTAGSPSEVSNSFWSPPFQATAFDCPQGWERKSYGSSGPIGTAVGQWLGFQYVLTRRKIQTYVQVDWQLYSGRADWHPGNIFALRELDPGVYLSLMSVKKEWPTYLRRPDILDADLDHVYEIKPVKESAEGRKQIVEYLQLLRDHAPTTPPWSGQNRLRNWQPGPWDPSGLRFSLPGIVPNHICHMELWRDELQPGLLLYDVVCCEPDGKKAEERPGLVKTAVTSIAKEIANARPNFERSLEVLPLAPPGSTFAFLATPRFFEVFVLKPADDKMTRLLQKQYPKPGPVLMHTVLTSLILAMHLPIGADIAVPLALASGYQVPDDLVRLYVGREVAGALTGLSLAVGEGTAAAAIVAPLSDAAGATGELAAEMAQLNAAAAVGPAMIEGTAIPASLIAASPYVGALATGEAVAVGTQLPAWMIAAVENSAVIGSGSRLGIGTVAFVLAGLASTEAEAATKPPPPYVGKVLGVDPILLVPIQLLVPKKGALEMGAQVYYGDEMYHIVGFAEAKGH